MEKRTVERSRAGTRILVVTVLGGLTIAIVAAWLAGYGLPGGAGWGPKLEFRATEEGHLEYAQQRVFDAAARAGFVVDVDTKADGTIVARLPDVEAKTIRAFVEDACTPSTFTVWGVVDLEPWSSVTAMDAKQIEERIAALGAPPSDVRVLVDRVSLPVPEELEGVGEPMFQYEGVAVREAVVEGAHVVDVEMIFDAERAGFSVRVTLNAEGRERLARHTRDHVGGQVAIVTDGRLDSRPTITGAIEGGALSITPNAASNTERLEAVRTLAARIRSAAAPPLELKR